MKILTGYIVRKTLEGAVKKFKRKRKLKKIDQCLEDIALLKKENAQLSKNANKNSKYTEELEKKVAILEKKVETLENKEK